MTASNEARTNGKGRAVGQATDASASGKLAPQRIAPGSTTQRHRTTSSWKLNQMLLVIAGLIGQRVEHVAECVELAFHEGAIAMEPHVDLAERLSA